MAMQISAALMFLSMVVVGRAQAQPTPGRWRFEAGVAGAPIGAPNLDLFVAVAARITTTGPLEWSAGVAAYGLATVSRADVVTLAIYCPVGCRLNDHSGMMVPVTAGVTIRLVGLPWIFNRIIPEFGTGGYYAKWKSLPDWDPDRPPLLTGYRVYAVGVRLSRRIGVSVGATQFRNVRNRDDRTAGRLAVQVQLP